MTPTVTSAATMITGTCARFSMDNSSAKNNAGSMNPNPTLTAGQPSSAPPPACAPATVPANHAPYAPAASPSMNGSENRRPRANSPKAAPNTSSVRPNPQTAPHPARASAPPCRRSDGPNSRCRSAIATSVTAAITTGTPAANSATAKNCAAPEYMINDSTKASAPVNPDCVAATPKENEMGKYPKISGTAAASPARKVNCSATLIRAAKMPSPAPVNTPPPLRPAPTSPILAHQRCPMSDADDAYAEAQRMIAEARARGATLLNLGTPKTLALATLPTELSTLKALTWLNLSRTEVTDIAPVAQLTALAILDLRQTGVTNLSALNQLNDLEELFLSRTQVSDLAPLSQLTALTTLDLSGTPVTDLAPLSHLTALATLILSYTTVTDFAPLTLLTTLSELDLSGTKVTDLAPLSQLTALAILDLSFNRLFDLSPLMKLTALAGLDLRFTPITDLAPLTQLTSLTTLRLDETEITDPRPLVNLTNLATSPQRDGLTFTNTPFAALPEFAGIAEIRDPAERAQRLFAALEGWKPPERHQSVLTDQPKTLLNSLPDPRPSPVQAVVTPDLIDLARGVGLLEASDAATRARRGWQSLKTFRDSFGASFQLQNYAPLPAILACFDAAMGDSYETCEPIDIGVHGLRLIAQSQSAALLETLPTGADAELRAFAAAISLFVDRFPDWQAYKADAPEDRPDVQMVAANQQAYVAIDAVVSSESHVSPDFKGAYHQLVVIGSSPDATEVEARGLMTSTRELARTMSEIILTDVKSGRLAKEQARQMSTVGQSEWPKIKYYGGGFVLDIVGRSSPSLRKLAASQPRSFGWVIPILDYLGFDDRAKH